MTVFISDFFTALQYSVRSSLILRNQSHRSSKQTYVAISLAGSFRGDLIRPPSPVWRHHVDISPMASTQADPRWEVIASQGCLSHSVSAVFNPLQCSALSNDCSEFCFRDEAGSEERGSRVFFFPGHFCPAEVFGSRSFPIQILTVSFCPYSTTAPSALPSHSEEGPCKKSKMLVINSLQTMYCMTGAHTFIHLWESVPEPLGTAEGPLRILSD